MDEIRIDTVSHGSYIFDADDVAAFDVREGTLAILDEVGDIFCLFAPGEWVFVGKVTDE